MHCISRVHSQLIAGGLKQAWVWLFDAMLSADDQAVKKVFKAQRVHQWAQARVEVGDHCQLDTCNRAVT